MWQKRGHDKYSSVHKWPALTELETMVRSRLGMMAAQPTGRASGNIVINSGDAARGDVDAQKDALQGRTRVSVE